MPSILHLSRFSEKYSLTDELQVVEEQQKYDYCELHLSAHTRGTSVLQYILILPMHTHH